jgi:hypothetical protein
VTKSRNINRPFIAWSAAEETLLRDLYPDVPCADIAALLGRTPGSVYQAAERLGLEKSAYFKGHDMSGRVRHGQQHPAMVANHFQPGHVPWNLGTHYVAGGRSSETRFKKGQLMGAAQHNYVPIGSLRVSKDGYLERKVTDDPTLVPARRWTGVHRLVWEAAHGPIPNGHVVCFLPGQRTQVLELLTLDRLECVSRATLAQRNHPRSYSPALAKLVQLKGQITRQVNRIKKSTPKESNHVQPTH